MIEYIRNIDQIKSKDVVKEIISSLPFDKRRNKCVYSLAKLNISDLVLRELIKSTPSEFDRKIDELPYAILFRAKTKILSLEFYDRSTKSICAINTQMRG
jgi:hypothetical protein